MNVKYQIFVSSTYEDLKDERSEVIKACLNMGHIPVGMEMFNAADEEQWAVITRTIDQCDYYVVIVAHRYGSTTLEGLSFTEKEYDYAISEGVPVLGFIIDESASWPNKWTDKDQTSVRNLKSKVKQKMVRFWSDKSELQAQFAISLGTTTNIMPRRGWVRAPKERDADVAQALSNLTEENKRLRDELAEARAARGEAIGIAMVISALTNLWYESIDMNGEVNMVSGDALYRQAASQMDYARGLHIESKYRKFEAQLIALGLVELKVTSCDNQILTLSYLGSLVYADLIARKGS